MLTIHTVHKDKSAILKLEGIIDLTTYEILLTHLKEKMEDGAESLILDLEEVILFDSTGIGELFYFLSEHKISLSFVNVPPFIQETLEMMGFFEALSHLYSTDAPADT